LGIDVYSNNSSTPQYVEVSGQLHDPGVLSPRKERPVTIE